MNQAPKTVLYLITKATWGGAQRYVYDLATHLSGEYRPIVAYGTRGRLAELLSEKKIGTVPIGALSRDIALSDDLSSFFDIWRLLRRIRPSAVHLNSSKAAGLGAAAARIAGVKKIIFTAHGWPFKEARGTVMQTAIYLLSWFTALLSTDVIVVSKADEVLGKRMWLIGRKVRYVPIGIEPPEFLPKQRACAELAITGSAPRIVTIAELTGNKGIRYAIEAVSELKRRGVHIEYFIIGDGEERELLKQVVPISGVADRVHFLGFKENAARYLKAFDLFLLPSIKEGMPYVLLEAAVAQLPIVTTTAVNPDLIDHYEHVHAVTPGDPDAIADALVDAMKAREERELFPASHIFTLDAMLERTIALYP